MVNTSNSSFIKFIKSSGIFFIGTVLSKAISIFMLPLYTSHISTGDMGYYDLSLTYVTIATSVLFIDIWVAILRYMYDGDSAKDKARAIRSGSIIFYISSGLYLIAGIICALFFNVKGIWWIVFFGLTQNITSIFSFTARGYGRNVEFAISGIIATVVNVTSNLICILVFSMGYESLYLSSILGFVAQVLFLALKTETLSSLTSTYYDSKLMHSMLKYSLPLCINSVSYWFMTSFNRTVINWVYGDSANGLYAIGNKFAFVISLVTTCFTYAWQDLAFSSASKSKAQGEFYSDACNLYSKVLAMCMAVILPCIKIVFPLLVNDSYAEAESTVPLFLITAIVSAISTFIGNVFYAIKDTKSIFYSMLTSAVFNLAMGYPLIKWLGLNGANIAIAASFVLNIVIREIILYKKIKLTMDFKILLNIGIIALSYIIYSFCDIWLNLVWLFVACALSVWIFRTYIFQILNALKKGGNNW